MRESRERVGGTTALCTLAVRLAIAGALCISPVAAGRMFGQDSTQSEILERLRRLEDEQKKLQELLKAKDARLNELERELDEVKRSQVGPPPQGTPAPAAPPTQVVEAAPEATEQVVEAAPEATEQAVEAAIAPEQRYFGDYVALRGFILAQTKWGEVVFSPYTYVRYLNQKGLDKDYINGFGETVPVDRRNDVELNKVKLEFKGWLLDPRFNYVLYSWTNNAAQGLGAQVVLGGSIRYVFADWFTLGGGIYPLPAVRSNEGAWPYFLAVDHRTMSDEFFRGSYTMGFFAFGSPLEGVQYSTMLGNNLSVLGVDAGQLDGRFATTSTAIWWMPTTGEFGTRGGFGDYDDHQQVATRIGGHFTFSPEDKQEQPGTDAPDNTQIRLSNATNIFTEGALAPGVQINNVDFYMSSFDGGIKYRGFALEGEYYLRWLNNFNATGPLPVDDVFDNGFQLQASAMLWPKVLQMYVTGSYVFGDFGDPWELSTGLNWWIFARREIRLNLEYIYDRKSVVGYTAIPQALGATGSIFNGNLEVFF